MRRCLSIFVLLWGFVVYSDVRPLVVASKDFNESYILGEMVAQTLESKGLSVERRFGLGGTLICFEALVAGEIDVYVEYTGTIEQAILKLPQRASVKQLNEQLKRRGLQLLSPLGFNNTYALAMPEAAAEARDLRRISQLKDQIGIRAMVSHEFLKREDGWPGLQTQYGIDWLPEAIEHGLAYQAIADGTIDLTDAYSTDGELARYQLRVLEDDKDFFPKYLAVPLIRRDAPQLAKDALITLGDTIDDSKMAAMNASVLFSEADFSSAAQSHLETLGITYKPVENTSTLRRNVVRHLYLTGVAIVSATLIGVLLSLSVFRIGWLSRSVVYVAGLLQTIPSIALLALMIPLFGIGVFPAIIALFLYSLLPIIRNSVTALVTVDPVLQRVAKAMGMSSYQQVRHVYLPLALPSILAGIRTAAVISIGTATLAAFIGAGGLGDPIVTGLSLNDTGLILQGAIPAALMAVFAELLFEAIERFALPKYLRSIETIS